LIACPEKLHCREKDIPHQKLYQCQMHPCTKSTSKIVPNSLHSTLALCTPHITYLLTYLLTYVLYMAINKHVFNVQYRVKQADRQAASVWPVPVKYLILPSIICQANITGRCVHLTKKLFLHLISKSHSPRNFQNPAASHDAAWVQNYTDI